MGDHGKTGISAVLPHFPIYTRTATGLVQEWASELRNPLLCFGAYYIAASLGMRLLIGVSIVSLLWPSNAIVVATLILASPRHWWRYLAAAGVAHVLALAPLGFDAPWLAFQIAYHSLMAVVIASSLRAMGFRALRLERLNDALSFLAAASIVPGIVSAPFILPMLYFAPQATLLRHGWSGGFWVIWGQRWIANSASLVLFAPPILAWSVVSLPALRRASRRRWAEATLLASVLIATCFLVFGLAPRPLYNQPALFVVPLPFLLWAAIRFGTTGLCTSLATVASIAAWCTFEGEGPFMNPSFANKAMAMQLFWIFLAWPLICLAAVIQERAAASQSLAESEQRFRYVADSAPMLVWVSGHEQTHTYLSRAWREFTGELTTDAAQAWMRAIHPGDLELWQVAYEKARAATAPFEIEYRLRRRDGNYRWILDVGAPRLDADGAILGYVGAAVDITDRRNDEEELRGLSSRLIHAQESERQRIARELHDDIGQRLSLLVVNLHLLGQGQESHPAGTIPATTLHEVLEDAHELVNDVHIISHGLHSAKLRLLGLGPAMRELCGQVAKQNLCEIELQAEGDWPSLPEPVSLCFYRVAQEAVSNAVRHSQARRVIVQLHYHNDLLRMQVRDRGKGFDPTAHSLGLGLVSMRERLRAIGGDLQVESMVGGGTRITAEWRAAATAAAPAETAVTRG